MKRSDFLKALAAVIVAPSVLVSMPQTATAAPVADKEEELPQYRAFWWKVSDEEVMDKAYMAYLLTDPRSDFRKAALKHGVDLNKPHTLSIGFVNDDFIRTLQTIVVKQPKAAA